MNTQSNTISQTHGQGRSLARAATWWDGPFYWSVRRELWEYRSIYLAPLAVAAIFVVGFIINMFSLRHQLLNATHQHGLLTTRYEASAALIMGTALIVGIFYSLDALYGERRDRSIFFWKSLPVSDLTAVLAKMAVPILILPLVSFVIAIATQFIMLLLSTIILSGSGISISELWTEASFFHVSIVILYHLLTVHGLWYAPFFGWFIFVSAWAPRAPFIWAFLPPFVISVVEKIAFNSSHFASFVLNRLAGPQSSPRMGPDAHTDIMATLIPKHFFIEPGLWTGLLIAAAFIAIAVRLRRYRGPI
jgi:ABC-2 type transport system permease protein